MTNFRNLLRIGSLAVVTVLTAGTGLAYGASFSGINGTTGPWSENTSVFTTDRTWSVAVVNSQDTLNEYVADINAGNNFVDFNTSVLGPTISGGVDLAIATAPAIDWNDTFSSLYGANALVPFGNGIVNTVAGNGLTGPNSLNENIINANQDTQISLVNNAVTTNDVLIDANTGNNFVDNNTTVGGVLSGSIGVSTTLNNGIGSVMPVVIPVADTGISNVIGQFTNNITGPNSINSNVLDANSIFNASVDNQSIVTNNFDLVANTGNNCVSNNTTVAGVGTGNVRVSIAATN